MADQALIQSFHTMWDCFPHRVRLIRKDRTVLAVNTAAAQGGFCAGARCVDTPPKAAHGGCLAGPALAEGRARYNRSVDGARIRFWIPVDGCKDIYVHFSIPVEELL